MVADWIRASGANVVALSETGGGATEAIADALGWQHTESGGDIDVISAVPIEANVSDDMAALKEVEQILSELRTARAEADRQVSTGGREAQQEPYAVLR